jgi:hypothetical protein
MGFAGKREPRSQSDNKPEYQASFVTRSHCLVWMGYERLEVRSFANRQEEEITGELTRAMQSALQDPRSPRWAKNFWAQEETRVHGHGRLGKRRFRIDIEIMRHGETRRPRFRFEAKRLHDTSSRTEYLGKDGLGCYLDGRYASDDAIAGMLGYVQKGTVTAHGESLAKALQADQEAYCVTERGQWTEFQVVKTLSTFRSIHNRSRPLPDIVVLHTILLFC